MDFSKVFDRRDSADSVMVPDKLLTSPKNAEAPARKAIDTSTESSSDSSTEDDEVEQSWGALSARAIGNEPSFSAECCICQEPMVRPAIGGGCAHHACLTCYEAWAVHKPSCPTCRAPVWHISVDFEFGKAVGCDMGEAKEATGGNLLDSRTIAGDTLGSELFEASDSTAQGAGETVVLRMMVAPAGITLGDEGGKVVVRKVKKGNGADRAGVKVRDIISKVNGTEVRDHATAVTFIERRCAVGDCELTIVRRRGSWMRILLRDLRDHHHNQ